MLKEYSILVLTNGMLYLYSYLEMTVFQALTETHSN